MTGQMGSPWPVILSQSNDDHIKCDVHIFALELTTRAGHQLALQRLYRDIDHVLIPKSEQLDDATWQMINALTLQAGFCTE